MTAPGSGFRHSSCVHCRASELSGGFGKPVPSHHARIQPVHLSSSSCTADDPDIWSVDLSDRVRDEEFLQAKSVRNLGFRNFMSSHRSAPLTYVNGSINARVLPTCKQIFVTFHMGKTATA
jgi:hypothetical protein